MEKNTISLADDLIIDIQQRLTVSSMRRLCCVSKSWNSLLTNPNFVYSSLFYSGQNNNDEEDAAANAQIVITFIPSKIQPGKRYAYTCLSYHSLLPVDDDGSVLFHSAFREFPDQPNPPLHADNSVLMLAGSCEGLICLIYVNYMSGFLLPAGIGLFNPVTNETKMLPPILPHDDDNYLRFGDSFGFALIDKQAAAAAADDDDQYCHFKVVTVRRCISEQDVQNITNMVYVFSSDDAESSLGWRELPALDSQLEIVNGIPQHGWMKKKNKYCYWLANNKNGGHDLVSFDPITELFHVEEVMPLTCSTYRSDFKEPPTVYMVKEETLVAVLNPVKEVCVLQRYLVDAGDYYSWRKLFTIELTYEGMDLMTIGLSKYGKLICVETSQTKFKAIDVITRENSTLPIEIHDVNQFVQLVTYVPSKMSLSSSRAMNANL